MRFFINFSNISSDLFGDGNCIFQIYTRFLSIFDTGRPLPSGTEGQRAPKLAILGPPPVYVPFGSPFSLICSSPCREFEFNLRNLYTRCKKNTFFSLRSVPQSLLLPTQGQEFLNNCYISHCETDTPIKILVLRWGFSFTFSTLLLVFNLAQIAFLASFYLTIYAFI